MKCGGKQLIFFTSLQTHLFFKRSRKLSYINFLSVIFHRCCLFILNSIILHCHSCLCFCCRQQFWTYILSSIQDAGFRKHCMMSSNPASNLLCSFRRGRTELFISNEIQRKTFVFFDWHATTFEFKWSQTELLTMKCFWPMTTLRFLEEHGKCLRHGCG